MSDKPQDLVAEVPVGEAPFSVVFRFRSSAKLVQFVRGIEKTLQDLEREGPEAGPVEGSPSEFARPKATATPFNSEIPKPPADFTPDSENVRFAVAKKFVELVKRSAHNGKTPTLLNILVRWIQMGGRAQQSELAAAAGLERNVSFRGAASVLQRHMNAAGGPKSTYAREMLKFQSAWYQRTDEIDGSAILTMEPEFFLYLHHRLYTERPN